MDVFVGQLLLVPYNFAPARFAFAQGQLMPLSQNTALFSLLGTNYGGDGRSTFGLPDLQGRLAIGQGQGPGLQSYNLGEKGGTEGISLLPPEIPNHTHNVMAVSQGPDQNVPPNYALADSPNLYANAVPNNNMNQKAIGLTGGNLPHNNIMPFLCLNWVIALQGIFPQRP